MPDGTIAPSLVAEVNQSQRIEDPDADLVFMLSMLPRTPHAYMLMACVCVEIDNTALGGSQRLSDLEDPLISLALNMPVNSLDDAVALLSVVVRGVELMEDIDGLDDENKSRTLAGMRKAMEGVLPFLSKASNVDLGAIRCDTFRLVDREAKRAASLNRVFRTGAAA